jgi:hypothetical protein
MIPSFLRGRRRRPAIRSVLALAALTTSSAAATSNSVAAPDSPYPRTFVQEQIIDPFLNESRRIAAIGDKGAALLRLVTDDVQLTQWMSTNARVFQEGLLETYVPGSSGLFAMPDLPGIVITTQLHWTAVHDLNEWPVDLAWLPLDPGLSTTGVAASVYTARFGDGPTHFGYHVTIDSYAAGILAPGPGFSGVVESFLPMGVIADDGPITTADAGEFAQLSLSGYFETPGNLIAWLAARAESGGGDSGPSSALPAPCDVEDLLDCLQQVAMNLQAALANAGSTFGPQIADLERQVAEAAQSALEAALAGAVGGAIGGATGSAEAAAGATAVGGPLAGGAVLAGGTVLGGALGAAGGLIAWAFMTDADEIATNLQNLRQQYQAAICAAMCAARDAAVDCFEEYCPNLAVEIYLQLTLALMQSGCTC